MGSALFGLALLVFNTLVVVRIVRSFAIRARPVHALEDDLRQRPPDNRLVVHPDRYRWLSVEMIREIAELNGLRWLEDGRARTRAFIVLGHGRAPRGPR